MVGAVRLEALGVFGRIALAKGHRTDAVRIAEADQAVAGNHGDHQAVDLPLGDSWITFTGAPAGGLLIDAPPGLGLAVALGGGSVQLSDHRSRWTLKPGDYGPVRIKGVNVSIEVLQ